MSNTQYDGKAALSPWDALQRGKTLGKRVVIPVLGGSEGSRRSSVNLMGIQGDDQYAQQLNLTLSPPRIIRSDPADPQFAGKNPQDLTNEIDNKNVLITLPNFVWSNPFVIVEWGIGGTSEDAEVDISNGLCVNLCASWLRLSAGVDGTHVTGVTPAFYVLSAFIGPGYPKSDNAQRTIVASPAVAPGSSSEVFAVPKYAKAVSLCGIQTDNATVNPTWSGRIVFWRGSTGVAVGTTNLVAVYAFDQSSREKVVVPDGAYYFTIINDTPIVGAMTVRFSACFDLAI